MHFLRNKSFDLFFFLVLLCVVFTLDMQLYTCVHSYHHFVERIYKYFIILDCEMEQIKRQSSIRCNDYNDSKRQKTQSKLYKLHFHSFYLI